jgi:hypothetical protein
MSQKHHKRTRAEILAKRRELDALIARRQIRLQPVESTNKYAHVHFGKKQQAKLARLYERQAMRLAA